MKKILLLSFVLLQISFVATAQEVANPANVTNYFAYNPAFAGSKNMWRVSINNQLRWYNITHKTAYNTFSVDLPYRNFGLGLLTSYNTLSPGFVNSGIQLAGAYRIKILGKFTFIPAIELEYNGFYLNTNQLIFYDQLSVYDGIAAPSAATLEFHSVHMLDASAGFVFQLPIDLHTVRPWWFNFGYAYFHIPELRLNLSSHSPYYFSGKRVYHAGLLIPVATKKRGVMLPEYKGLYAYPNVKITSYPNFTLFSGGLLLYRHPFMIGLSGQYYSTVSLYNKAQIILNIGVEKAFAHYFSAQFMYSVDFGSSILNNTPLFITHEFSVILHFANRRITDCPNNLKYNGKRKYPGYDTQQFIPGECPPGMTRRRSGKDSYPTFYPVELPDVQ